MEALRIKLFCSILSWIIAVVFTVFQFFGENLFRVLHCYLEIPLTVVCCVVSTFLSVRTFRLLFHPLFRDDFWSLFFKCMCIIAILFSNIKFPIFYFEWITAALYTSIDIKSDQLWLLFETLIQTFQLWFCLDCYIDLEKIEVRCLARHMEIKPFGQIAMDLGYLKAEAVKQLLDKQSKIKNRQEFE